MVMETTLSIAGFDVTCVRSGKEAHAWLDQRLPDVVIVDVQLSDGKCTDVVSRLVEANIPFIVYSGDNPSSHTNTPFAHGAWVSKPCAPDELVGGDLGSACH